MDGRGTVAVGICVGDAATGAAVGGSGVAGGGTGVAVDDAVVGTGASAVKVAAIALASATPVAIRSDSGTAGAPLPHAASRKAISSMLVTR